MIHIRLQIFFTYFLYLFLYEFWYLLPDNLLILDKVSKGQHNPKGMNTTDNYESGVVDIHY